MSQSCLFKPYRFKPPACISAVPDRNSGAVKTSGHKRAERQQLGGENGRLFPPVWLQKQISDLGE